MQKSKSAKPGPYTDITPDDIQTRAYDALISVNQLMHEAKVSGNTLWRWRNGVKPRQVTVGKIMRALEAFEGQ